MNPYFPFNFSNDSSIPEGTFLVKQMQKKQADDFCLFYISDQKKVLMDRPLNPYLSDFPFSCILFP